MRYEYGLKVNGQIVAKYLTPAEAYEAAKSAYQETGVFHEVVLLHGE